MDATMIESRGDAPLGPHLLASVAGQLVALDLASVIQVFPMMAVDRIPSGPAGLLGFANLESEPVPVVKVRALFGLPDPADDCDHHVVLCSIGGRRVALAVDEARSLCQLATMRVPAPEDDAPEGVVGFVGLVGGRICSALDLPRAVGRLMGTRS